MSAVVSEEDIALPVGCSFGCDTELLHHIFLMTVIRSPQVGKREGDTDASLQRRVEVT